MSARVGRESASAGPSPRLSGTEGETSAQRLATGVTGWEALARVTRRLIDAETPEDVAAVAVDEARHVLGARAAALWETAPDGSSPRLLASAGPGADSGAAQAEIGRLASFPGTGRTDEARAGSTPVEARRSDPTVPSSGIEQSDPAVAAPARRESAADKPDAVEQNEDQARDNGTAGSTTDTGNDGGRLALPLLVDDRLIGVLLVVGDAFGGNQSSEHGAASGAVREVTRGFAEICAVAIENARRVAALQESERARAEAEERYWRLLEGEPQAIAVHRNGEILYANPAAARLVGVPDPAALIGRSLLEFAHPEDREIALARVRQASLDPGPVESPIRRFVRPDGQVVDADIVSIPALYGGAPSAHVVIRDVTDRKRAEAALRATTWELQALVGASPLAVVALDPDGNVTTWNDAAEALFGWTAAEALGRPFPAVPEERHEEFRTFMARTLAEGSLVAVETQRRRRNGRLIDVSIWTAPLRDAVGAVRGVTGFFSDISTRKRIEAAQRFLADASEVLSTSLEDSTALGRVAALAVPSLADWCTIELVEAGGTMRAIAAAGGDGALEGESDRAHALALGDVAAEASRRTRATLVGMGAREIVAPLVAQGRILGAVRLGRRADGLSFDADDLAVAEEVARRIALAVDNARLYREAQAAIRARDEFLSVAAHELRTPIAGISAQAQLVARLRERGQLTNERVSQFVDTMETGAQRLGSLTEELLDIARIRSGRLELQTRAIDVAELVAGLVERQRAGGEGRHRFELERAPGDCTIVGDAERLTQVFENLLDNAVKYSPGGGAIVVTVARRNEDVLVRISDEGIGLAAGEEETIFQPFGRAANAARRHLPGMGLGLYISRNIVEQHGGRVWAESVGEERGLHAYVSLPVGTVTEAGERVE